MKVAEELAAVLECGDVLLFAGAGCSAEANVPAWPGYLEALASVAERYEPEVGSLMRKRIAAGEFLKAASLFKRTLSAPMGDKMNAMSEPFRPGRYDHTKLLALASLPFRGIVTTNYDSSLLEASAAIATQRSLQQPQAMGTRHTKGAAYVLDPFVLFLHGQASLNVQAEDMVFDEEDYDRCYGDAAFTDGLIALLSGRICLFVGFSFRDPGLDAVLRTWVRLRGPAFPRKHYAVLPVSESRLASKLAEMNVQVLRYDASAGHNPLWEDVRKTAKSFSGRPPAIATAPKPLEATRSVLAMCYARAALGKGIQPLRTLVVDGLTLAVITEASPGGGRSIEDLIPDIAHRLGVLPDEIKPEVVLAVQRLERQGACHTVGSRIEPTGSTSDSLSQETRRLAEHVVQRIELREGVHVPLGALGLLAQAFEDLLIARAWDLAAHFVQPRFGALPAIDDAVSAIVRSTTFPPGLEPAVVTRGIVDLLVRPNSSEAQLLSELGRVAFVVQLALGHARSTFSHALSIPQRVYLDASVLMPAIVEGHPLFAVYWPVLERLRDQAVQSGAQLEIVAPLEFLDEVVHHRQLAIQEVARVNLEDPDRLQREILIRGAENVNVFIGAYATKVGRSKRKISFRGFLESVAPYDNEQALSRYLQKRGLQVERLAPEPPSFKPMEFWNWFNPLKAAYEEQLDLWERTKPTVLIEHEAWQLLRIERDHQLGVGSVFVTGDGKLRRAVAGMRGGELADALLSALTMVKLVDLLLGVRVDHRGLARLLWGVHAVDPSGAVRQYFTDLGLKKQGDIETLALPAVVERVMGEVSGDPGFSSLPVTSKDVIDRAKVASFLDRFEDRFYELLHAAVSDRVGKLSEESQRKQPRRIAKTQRRKLRSRKGPR
jgi:hypothetical protein